MMTVPVNLGERTYPVLIGSGTRAELGRILEHPGSAHSSIVVADRTVADLHWTTLRAALAPQTPLLVFPAGEDSKSLLVAAELFNQLAAARIERGAVIVAFGGGVAGDLVGFIAATWLRGVGFVQVPTTLLAAIDASIGGKTGLNIAAGKNLVGVFHQPRAVIVDTDFLATLPQREFRAGLAESVKHAVIRDADFLAWHEQHAEQITARDADILASLIARNCTIKAEIVARDEREEGLRAILNYGHTIAHGIEHILHYELRHGECVALGMIVENEMARVRGWLPPGSAERIRVLLAKLGLPANLPRPIAADVLWSACAVDKKVRAGAVNFVLVRDIGRPERVADITVAEVSAALRVIQPG